MSGKSGAIQVNLVGVLHQSVFRVVFGSVDIGTTATMNGVILGKTAINVATLATVNGRLLAQTAVNLDQATVTQP